MLQWLIEVARQPSTGQSRTPQLADTLNPTPAQAKGIAGHQWNKQQQQGGIFMTMAQQKLFIYVFSQNYFLWNGIRHSLAWLPPSRQEYHWLADMTLAALAELIKDQPAGALSIIVTETSRIQTLRQLLPRGILVMGNDEPLCALDTHLNSPSATPVPPVRLTRAELKVCTLISEGHPPAGIARLLNKSQKTINGHKRSAMHKLSCHSSAELWTRLTQFSSTPA